MPRKQAEFAILKLTDGDQVERIETLTDCHSTAAAKKHVGSMGFEGRVMIVQIRADLTVKLETKTLATFE